MAHLDLMGQLQIAGLTFNGASDKWVVIRITKDGDISFDDALPIWDSAILTVPKNYMRFTAKKPL